MIKKIAETIIGIRSYILCFSVVMTLVMVWFATGTTISSGYYRLLPTNHPITNTFLKHLEQFGGGDKIFIAVTANNGTIYEPEFLKVLKNIAEDAYYLKGVDRAREVSLFSPNVVYIEIVDGGFQGGLVVGSDFNFSPESIEKVRQNVQKAGVVGSLVSNDYTSSMVQLEILHIDPSTGKPFNPLEIYQDIQEKIRKKYESDAISIQIIGFNIAIGEISEGTQGVLIFLFFAVIVIAFLSKWFLRGWQLTITALTCSLLGVIWNLGIVNMLGYGLDILSILVPFLVFAIGMSHSIQILNRINITWDTGSKGIMASVRTLEIMMMPALIALLTELVGAVAIIFIPIPSVQELRVFTSTGVICLMFTNVILLTVITSYLDPTPKHLSSLRRHFEWRKLLWVKISVFATRKYAIVMCTFSLFLIIVSGYYGKQIQIGDLHPGVPELKASSQYNQDTLFISQHYSLGSDIFTTFVEGVPLSCIDFNVIKYADDLGWEIANNSNVHSVVSMAKIMQFVSATWGEGHPKWMGLRPEVQALKVAASPIKPHTGLTNTDCSVMPIIAFLKDHKATSLISVIDTINQYKEKHKSEGFSVTLASGNAGTMAAVNETVAASELPLMLSLFGSVTILCYLLFRSWRSTVCVIIPLLCVSIFGYAVLYLLEIGLKTSTLPVVALGTGLGVDYGIYIFTILLPQLERGANLQKAYFHTLEQTGSAVCFIGLTLSIAVGTWMFSDLKFQADMGLLFSSMLILNMFGALFVLPGIAYFLFPNNRKESN